MQKICALNLAIFSSQIEIFLILFIFFEGGGYRIFLNQCPIIYSHNPLLMETPRGFQFVSNTNISQ